MEYDIVYIVLQSKYRKMHHNQKDIFPKEWYNLKEYEIKKHILKECIERKCVITETKNYLTFRRLALK